MKINNNFTNEIKNLSKEFAFDVCKITRPFLDKKVQDNLKKYISNSYHGEMNWLKDTFHRRKSPNFLWKDAKSLIILGVNYGPKTNPLKKLSKIKFGNISVYAHGEDYHKFIKGRLKQFASKLCSKFKEVKNSEIKVFVDTAPIMEKPLAQMAGLGWQGKHTNLVSKDFGSWLFLGLILIDKNLPFDKPQSDHCGNCKSCIEICPTQAIVNPYQLDSRKCISYLTIEHKGEIPLEFRKKIGNRIFGCDDCLSICPWNKFAKKTNEIKLRARNYNLKLSNLLKLKDDEFKKMFSKSSIKRIGRNRFIRNCCIAAGNSKDKSLIKSLKDLIKYEKEKIIKNSASWALQQLEK